APELGVVGVGEKRHVRRRLERERIARLAPRGCLLARQLERRRGQAGDIVAVGDVERERVGRVQHVLAEAVAKGRKLLADSLEAAPGIAFERDTAETKIAQGVVDGLATG